MSIFTITTALCDKIEKMMNTSWWEQSSVKNKGFR